MAFYRGNETGGINIYKQDSGKNDGNSKYKHFYLIFGTITNIRKSSNFSCSTLSTHQVDTTLETILFSPDLSSSCIQINSAIMTMNSAALNLFSTPPIQHHHLSSTALLFMHHPRYHHLSTVVVQPTTTKAPHDQTQLYLHKGGSNFAFMMIATGKGHHDYNGAGLDFIKKPISTKSDPHMDYGESSRLLLSSSYRLSGSF
ncbi:hypothetical protein BC941DRAFT_509407 [Chlamydoabsidia padenii]|nr:hypothetical protein BC941DRAFT_509407 [Chlamydoabsidia padenii]